MATEILSVSLRRHIIFASAYVREALLDSAKQLKHAVEILEKPFKMRILVETIEDKKTYGELEKNWCQCEKDNEIDPLHDKIKDLLDGLKKIVVNSSAQ